MAIHNWSAWEITQKSIHRNKVSWSELALRITWGFQGNLELWWSRMNESNKLNIMNSDKPVAELVREVLHEFYGEIKVDGHHYAYMFMSQTLCDIKEIPEFFCTMQDLLYKARDPQNTTYFEKIFVCNA